MTDRDKRGEWRRRGTPAWRRPAGKKGLDYEQVTCPNCRGRGGNCPLCEGHRMIWAVL